MEKTKRTRLVVLDKKILSDENEERADKKWKEKDLTSRKEEEHPPRRIKKVKKRKDGQITRRVLLGARMAVRKEEQRVRPRVREPNAFVRGKRQRYREARI